MSGVQASQQQPTPAGPVGAAVDTNQPSASAQAGEQVATQKEFDALKADFNAALDRITTLEKQMAKQNHSYPP